MAKNQIDLEKLSVPDLTQLIEEAKAALESKKGEAKNQLIEEMREKARQLGLDLGDLIQSQQQPKTNVRKVRQDAGKQVPVKFRSPEGETWSGRGRQPKWLTDALHHGKTKEEFAV